MSVKKNEQKNKGKLLPKCRVCCDTGIVNGRITGTTQDYCDCPAGKRARNANRTGEY